MTDRPDVFGEMLELDRCAFQSLGLPVEISDCEEVTKNARAYVEKLG